MPCPICGSGYLKLQHMDIEYVEEPYDFIANNICHQHDNNNRIGTWLCDNGHIFELRHKIPCIGCHLEKSLSFKYEKTYDLNL